MCTNVVAHYQNRLPSQIFRFENFLLGWTRVAQRTMRVDRHSDRNLFDLHVSRRIYVVRCVPEISRGQIVSDASIMQHTGARVSKKL